MATRRYAAANDLVQGNSQGRFDGPVDLADLEACRFCMGRGPEILIMIIAIDGPAGAGKTSVSVQVAEV